MQSSATVSSIKRKKELLPRHHWIVFPGGEEKEKGAENLQEEIIAENFPNLGKETDIQIQEAQRVPNKMTPKRPTPRHIIIKVSKVKDKEKILKQQEKNNLFIKGNPDKTMIRFFSRNFAGQRRVARFIQSAERKKTVHQEYSTWQVVLQGRRREERVLQTSKS